MDWLIVLGIVIAMYLLGRYAIIEGQRSERQKEFERNLKKWDEKHKTNQYGKINKKRKLL